MILNFKKLGLTLGLHILLLDNRKNHLFRDKIDMNFKSVVNQILGRLFLSDDEKQFILYNRSVWKEFRKGKEKHTILFDFHCLAETNIAYSYFLNILAKKTNSCLKTYSNRSRLFKYAQYKILRSFNADSNIVIALSKKQSRWVKRQALILSLENSDNLFNLCIEDIWIGIDIYETYLRRYSKATIDISDKKLKEIVIEALTQVRFWSDYFLKNSVKAAVLSHDVYVEMNILAKIAYKNGVSVYLPNCRGISRVKEPFSCYKYLLKLPEMFNKLPRNEQINGMEFSKKQLKRRLTGEVGVDMAYSTKSAFSSDFDEKAKVLNENSKLKVLITTHDFFDNPHAYGVFQFHDFFEWITFLAKIEKETDYDWYLKTHPDATEKSLKAIDDLRHKFNNLTIIPSETSHIQIAKEGIDFVLTGHGTVGHEYPLLGVQVINAAYNPHIAYKFNHHATNTEDYEKILKNLDDLNLKIDKDKVYEFYYMFKKYCFVDDLIFHSYTEVLAKVSSIYQREDAIYKEFIDQQTDEKHIETIQRLEEFIDSGKQYLFMNGPEGVKVL
jgi:hypothetical protein